MSKKKGKNNKGGLVYSTHPEAAESYFNNLFSETEENNSPDEHEVRVWLEKKHRGGKEVTIIRGLEVTDDVLKELASKIKSKCGVGGSAKEGEIIIQGDQRDKVVKILHDEGYKNSKKAGA